MLTLSDAAAVSKEAYLHRKVGFHFARNDSFQYIQMSPNEPSDIFLRSFSGSRRLCG